MKVSKTGYKKNSKDKNEKSLLIPSNQITMKDVEFPVFGTDDTGYSQMMYPGLDYSFPGNYVYELPMAKNGGHILPGRYRNPEGNWLSKYSSGGDISIPDLSNKGWLSKYQTGGVHQKIYTDPLEFAKANRAYNDSLSLYNNSERKLKEFRIFGDANNLMYVNPNPSSSYLPFEHPSIAPIDRTGFVYNFDRTNPNGEVRMVRRDGSLDKNLYQEASTLQRKLSGSPSSIIPIYKKPTEKPKLDQQAVMQQISKDYPGYSIKFEKDKIFIREPETEYMIDNGIHNIWQPLPIKKSTPEPIQYKGLTGFDRPEQELKSSTTKIGSTKTKPIMRSAQDTKTGQYQIGYNYWDDNTKSWKQKMFSKETQQQNYDDVKVPNKKTIKVPPQFQNGGSLNKYQDGGSPEPMSWTEYLKYMGADDAELKSINPRDYLLWEEDQHTLLKDLDPEKAKTARAAKINFYDKSARHTPHESDLLTDAYASRRADLIDTYNLLYFNNDKQDYSGSPGNATKRENGEDVFYPGKFAIENEGNESLTAQEILNRTKKNYSLPVQDYASQRIKNRPNYADTKISYTRVYPRTLLIDYNNPSADFNAGIEFINDPRYTDVYENFYSDPPSSRPMSFFPAPSYNYTNVPKKYDEKGNEVVSKYDIPNLASNTYYDFPGSNTEMIYNEKLRLNDITKENIRNIKTIDPSGNIGDLDYSSTAAKRYINDPWFFYGEDRKDGDPYCINCDKLAGSEHSQDELFDYFKFTPQLPSSKQWWFNKYGLKPPRPVFLNQNYTKSGQVQIGWDVWDPKRKQWKAQYFNSDEIDKRREDVKVPKDGGQDVNFRTGVIHDLTPVNKDKETAPVKKKIVVPPGFQNGGSNKWLDKYQPGGQASSKYDLMRVDQPTAVASSTNVVVPNIDFNKIKTAQKIKELNDYERNIQKIRDKQSKTTLKNSPKQPDVQPDVYEQESYPPENYSETRRRPGVSGSMVTVFVDPKTGEEWISPGQQAAQEGYNELSRSNNIDPIGTGIAAASVAAPLVRPALSYLNAPAVLPYFGEVPWLTANNVIGAAGATDAMVNRFPEIPGQLFRGEYMDAGINALTGTLDLFGANMVSPFKASKVAKQLPESTDVDPELEAIRKILRKNVTYPKHTGPASEPGPWPNRFLEQGDNAWSIGNMETGRTSDDVSDIPLNLPIKTPRRLPGVNGTLYPDRVPQQLPGSPNVDPPIQQAGFFNTKGALQKYPKGKLTQEEIDAFKNSDYYKQSTKEHLELKNKYGNSWTLPNYAEEALQEAITTGNRGRINPILYGGRNWGATDYTVAGLAAMAYPGVAGLYGLAFSPPAVKNKVLNTAGITSTPGTLSSKDTTINITNRPMDFAKVNETADGQVIIGGEFIEGANNTVRKAKDWLTATDTYSDKEYPSKDIQSFYGIEDGKFKVGKSSDFKPNTEIVPRRFGESNISQAVLNEGAMRLLDAEGNPIYQNTPNTGKFILYSPSTKESEFAYINTGKSGVDKVNSFLKKNKDAQYIHLDNGRYEFYGLNPEGLTNQDFRDYYQQDLEREGNPGYNMIIKKYGGWLNKYQDGGSRDMPLGLPLREQNPYLLPEYNQPIANGYILPDPNRPQLLNTGATEYKYSYGMDDREVQVPSVVAGQYIGDKAFDRYMISGEEFKPMLDPGAYSKYYNMLMELGLMQKKKGGEPYPSLGYYEYIGGYKGVSS